MPESFEKRQRDRRKQQKRKEKRERKLQRKADKTRGPLYHTLFRDRDQHQFETDLWLSVIDLVAVGGWTPPEAIPSGEPPSSAFVKPDGLALTEEVAQGLGKSIASLLDTISEEELPLSDYPFGDKHTESLLIRRAGGEKLDLEDSAAAYELLSGPPKKEVGRLAEFLQAGAATIEAN
jgi:hypothetical protein